METMTCKVSSQLSQDVLAGLEELLIAARILEKPWWEIMGLPKTVKQDSHTWPHNQPYTLYHAPTANFKFQVTGCGAPIDVTREVMGSGRSNYPVIQKLVARAAGLTLNTEGQGSDLVDADGRGYEVKAFLDTDAHPGESKTLNLFHTSASSTFARNGQAAKVNQLLDDGQYQQALQLCRATGYDRNDFYLYTNTREFSHGGPLKYIIIPTAAVLENISKHDPRLIDRRTILALATQTVEIQIP